MASLFIGSGHTARSVSRQQLPGIGEFDTSVAYPAGALVMYTALRRRTPPELGMLRR